jgi:DEAD/DEAH box helicase/Helicase C-terminal domain
MAFKKTQPPATIPDSPDKLLLDLPRRKIPDVLPHQREVMRTYAATAADHPDVALQLPTGSGKTLVGLLIAEWRRRKNQERIVYLCPTRQLVNQVVEQAEEKYGLTVLGFTGRVVDYSPTAKAEYRNADRIAITTHSSLFNTNPFFHDGDVVIVDDAHAAENYVAALWSVRVERSNPAHSSLHAALRGVLRSLLDPVSFARLSGKLEGPADRSWVDNLPIPEFAKVREEIAEILDVHADSTDLKYPWSMIRDHLFACHLYLSCDEILIRPLIPPSWTLPAFSSPKQRIYMSATLGAGGDLERLMGRRTILRLPIPEGWDRHGVGRRFFVFPEMSLLEEEAAELRRQFMIRAGRSLVLVPSDRVRDEIAKDVKDTLGFSIFTAEDIENSKKPFVAAPKAVAIVANRYDGIDFPGDECRLLFMEGLPKATNLQERFLMARMGANALFNERIQTRILQALGRCTRSLEDYSAIVVSGGELPDYLSDIRRRKFLHPELQAEIKFGVDQSKGVSLTNLAEDLDIFLKNGEDWEEVNLQIVAGRKLAVQEPFPAMDELRTVVAHEVDFQHRLWQGDYEAALECSERVLGGLTASELRGYRALWHYLAGSAAWLGATSGGAGLDVKARLQFGRAKDAAVGIPWLVVLARYHAGSLAVAAEDVVLMEQVERVEAILAQLGTVHDRAFAIREKEILEGLDSKEKGPFEQAHRLLGELIGFDAGKVEEDGSPDPWWIVGNLCFVFEDHAGAQCDTALDVKKARQVASHPAWMRSKVETAAKADILPVLVTPVTTAREGALPHLIDVALWPVSEFRSWAQNAIAIVRQLRVNFIEPGNLEWRARASEQLKENGMDAGGCLHGCVLEKRLTCSLPSNNHTRRSDTGTFAGRSSP